MSWARRSAASAFVLSSGSLAFFSFGLQPLDLSLVQLILAVVGMHQIKAHCAFGSNRIFACSHAFGPLLNSIALSASRHWRDHLSVGIWFYESAERRPINLAKEPGRGEPLVSGSA
jgi:hypothetical protein